jgi:hypothetical protein
MSTYFGNIDGCFRNIFWCGLNFCGIDRPWIDSNVETANQDPLTIYELGRIAVDVRASEVLLKQAAQSAMPTSIDACMI